MSRKCGVFVGIFGILYLIALGLLMVGTFGLFGQERDPLSGVFLLPLGLPWNLLASDTPEAVRPWLASLAPALNLVLVWFFCRRLGGPAN